MKRKRERGEAPASNAFGTHKRTNKTGHKRAKLSHHALKNVSGRSYTRSRKRGPPRPKTALSFDREQTPAKITKSIQPKKSDTKPQHTNDEAQSSTDRLRNIIHLMNLLVRRNKNQHRNQPFWKHLLLLRRSLTKLFSLYTQLASVSLGAPQQTRHKSTTTTADEVRARFQTKSLLRSEKDVVEEHIREILMPECFVRFSSLVADSQFANLGLVLLGLLGDVADIVGTMKRNVPDPYERMQVYRNDDKVGTSHGGDNELRALNSPMTVLGTSTKITGKHHGETVQHVYGTSTGNDSSSSSRQHSPPEGTDFGSVVQRSSIDELQYDQASERTVPMPPADTAERRKVVASSGELKHAHRSSVSPRPSSPLRSATSVSEPDSRAREEVEHSAKSSRRPAAKPSKKKKNKKKGGAFDELFKGLR